ncbi:MAG: ABC-type transporter, integral rane subunit [Desulfacinum sp.]|jgi:branched-chain amino acid transport system permease protein|nr:ABC-type transporter, integral rane subunit [Desulfacinum sp.]
MWFQLLLNTLSLGSFYALVALGFSLIFGVTHTFNLAHGELIVLSGYMAYGLSKAWQTPFALTLPLCMAAMACLGQVLLALVRRIREPFELSSLVFTFGLALVIQNAMLFLFTADYRRIPASGEPLRLAADLIVTRNQLWLIGLSLAATALVYLMLRKTFLGMALRAVIQEREAARLAGIRVERMNRIAFAVGGALIGLAGPLFGQNAYLHPAGGMEATLIAVVITRFAGTGRIRGLLAGAWLLALLESAAALWLGSNWRELVSAGILITLLVWKPEGLLARKKPAPEL